MICNDGAFVEPTAWPAETECEEVPVCTGFPSTPPADSLMNGTNLVELASGKSIFYTCVDDEAILDDGSGLNFVEFFCNGTTWGHMDSNGTFVAGQPTTWPKCRSECKVFDIGEFQTPPLTLNMYC